MLNRWTSLALGFAVALILGTASQAADTERGDRLRVIVPVGAGGALDRFARTVEQFLPSVANVEVVVENHSPKNGKDGYEAFLHRPADGSTILAWFEPAASAYQPGVRLDDLAIINVQEIEPPILVARKDTGWATLLDMVAAVRQAPNKYRLSVGSRTGGGPLLTTALLANLELEMTEVNYASGGKARKALVQGEAELTAGSLNAIRKLGDQVIPLAVFSPRRLRAWPEVPTIHEALGPDAGQAVLGAVYRFFAVHRVFAEAEPEAFQDLVEAFRSMTEEDADFREDAYARGVGAHWFGPVESTALIQRSHQHFSHMIARQHIP